MTEPTKLTPEVERRLTVWMTQYMEQHRPSGGDWYLQLAKEAIHALGLPEGQTLEDAWLLARKLGHERHGDNLYPDAYGNEPL
jgi:hypothetical protein